MTHPKPNPAPVVTRADCVTCGACWTGRTASAVGAKHAVKHGHVVNTRLDGAVAAPPVEQRHREAVMLVLLGVTANDAPQAMAQALANAEARGREAGKLEERAKIVAWLREHADEVWLAAFNRDTGSYRPSQGEAALWGAQAVSGRIEAGEHEK